MNFQLLCAVILLILSTGNAAGRDLREMFGAIGTKTVQTSNGPVTGFTTANSQVYLGIQYGAAPVGDLRFMPSQPPQPWTKAKNAFAFGPACYQHCELPFPQLNCPIDNYVSENCLFLNVFAPLNSTEPLPVLFWIHGGRFEQGAGGTLVYQGDWFAQNSDVIIVTINYRLSGFGGLVYPGLYDGNQNLKDQRLALQWVQSNIGTFGGDPTQVLIYGQSAGGCSVASHMASPLSKGLFSKAIVESNPWGIPKYDELDGAEMGKRLAKDLGCDITQPLSVVKSCIQGSDPDLFLNASHKAETYWNWTDPWMIVMPWAPVVDQVNLNEPPLFSFINGNIPSPVPFIAGNVNNEGYLFVNAVLAPDLGVADISYSEYHAVIELFFGIETASKIFKQYPPMKNKNNIDLASHLVSDYLFLCPNRAASRGAQQSGKIPGDEVYMYRFNHTWSFSFAWAPFKMCEGIKVCHASELPYVFHDGEIASKVGITFTEIENEISDILADTWVAFAKTNNPNNPSLPDQWPSISASASTPQPYQYFGNTTSLMTGLRKPYCDFWDDLGYDAVRFQRVNLALKYLKKLNSEGIEWRSVESLKEIVLRFEKMFENA